MRNEFERMGNMRKAAAPNVSPIILVGLVDYCFNLRHLSVGQRALHGLRTRQV
jgi:hypothetical protein